MSLFRTLISDSQLVEQRANGRELLVVDCRFDLGDTQRGTRAYAAGHIPGAVYAHLDRDLSGTGEGLGRHPLPEAGAFSSTLACWGWRPGVPVVAYDDAGGAIAARLWWLLRLVGVEDCAVLDGGWQAWQRAEQPTEQIPANPQPQSVENLRFAGAGVLYHEELQQALQDYAVLLVDVRAAPRFRGESEPIDKLAGHIPGAVNRPFAENLDAPGNFKPAETLRAEFKALIGDRPATDVVHMCGSGVTACHGLLAMEHAGLPGSRIYAPSWSGWISDPSRPIARGADA